MQINSIRPCILALFAALTLSAFFSPASAQTAPRISVITFQAGTVYWQRFGHNAILVRDRGKQITYNYGIFDFAQENFMLNFAAGQMQYQLAAQPLNQALYPYHIEGRWALEQQLNLKPDEARELAKFLTWNAQPENAEYHYDYFIANCSTKVRDALDQALSGILKEQLRAKPGKYNYREQIARVSAPDPLVMLGMDIGLGTPVDEPINLWQESFIPGVLMHALRDVRRTDGAPLVAGERYLLESRLAPEPAIPPVLWPWFLALGVALAVALLLLGKVRAITPARVAMSLTATLFMLTMGVGGVTIASGWGLTAHWGMAGNQNLLLLNPLCLLLLPLWFGSARRQWRPSVIALWLSRAIAVGALLSLLLHLLPGTAQGNLHWIALLLPIHLALVWSVPRHD